MTPQSHPQLRADLAAQRQVAAEIDKQKIAIEIKSFLGHSPVQDFKNAVGQFVIYRLYLSVIEPERIVYLAVSDSISNRFFKRRSIDYIVQEAMILIIVVNLLTEEIVQWID